jgi:hypothetical protein
VNVCCLSGGSSTVAADFQTNVINQHPAFVLITTGESDVTSIHDSTPLGVEWHVYEEAIMQMVEMAQKANIKVILGNTPAQGYDGQFFNVWLAIRHDRQPTGAGVCLRRGHGDHQLQVGKRCRFFAMEDDG